MSDNEKWETVYIEDCVGVRNTDGGALLFTHGGHTYTVPQSLVREDSEVWGSGDKGTLAIPRFIALEKKLI